MLYLSLFLNFFPLSPSYADDLMAAANGECGPHSPYLRVTGVSSNSKELALQDANVLAYRKCKRDVCQKIPGAATQYCGIHEYDFQNDIHIIKADYRCSCAF